MLQLQARLLRMAMWSKGTVLKMHRVEGVKHLQLMFAFGIRRVLPF